MEPRLNSAFQAAADSKTLPGVGGIILDKSGDVLWRGAFGTTNLLDPAAEPFTPDTPTMVYSCTKLVTTIVALQFLEEGKLKLDDPVEKFDPEFAKLQVLEGFDAEGKPKTRAPKTKATILHLMTHTTGLAYDFFDQTMLRWRIATGQTPAQTMAAGVKKTYAGPLLFEPGEQFSYGMNTDWLGFVLEAIAGKRLADIVEERIIKPLQLKNTGHKFDGSKPRMVLHLRGEDGTLFSVPDLKPLEDPEVHGGGEYLIASINDFAQILLPLLNGGEHPKLKVRVLQPETVQKYLFTDQISAICKDPSQVGYVSNAIAQLTLTGEMLPGVKKTWSTALLLNEEDTPFGRKGGSGAWAGLANSYYFVDPTSGKLAFFASNLCPFFDPPSLQLFDELERAAYGHPAKESSEAGGNYGPWEPPKATL